MRLFSTILLALLAFLSVFARNVSDIELAKSLYYGRGMDADYAKVDSLLVNPLKQGDPDAEYLAAMCIVNGYVENERGYDVAKLLTDAADRGNSDALFQMTLMEGFHKSYLKKAVESFTLASAGGDDHASVLLGRLLCTFPEISPDSLQACQQAVALFKSARRNDGEAEYYLALCYANGLGVEKNVRRAISLMESSASYGFRDAFVWLGDFMAFNNEADRYSFRLGLFTCYESAAWAGDPHSCFMLGILYEKMNFELIDADAYFWFDKASRWGEPNAMFKVASALENGTDGFPVNENAAGRLYRRSAAAGVREACFKAGWAYEEGWGGAIDYTKALACYKLASASNPSALFRFGRMLYFGLGTEHDEAKALMYISAAEKKGDADAAAFLKEITENQVISPTGRSRE